MARANITEYDRCQRSVNMTENESYILINLINEGIFNTDHFQQLSTYICDKLKLLENFGNKNYEWSVLVSSQDKGFKGSLIPSQYLLLDFGELLVEILGYPGQISEVTFILIA